MSASHLQADSIAAFLYREARLLDERQFEAWVDLFTDDGLYWVPLEPGQTDDINVMSIFRDDKPLLQARVARLRHPEAHADTPAPRSVHMLSNIEVVGPKGDDIDVAATVLMIEWRDQRQTVYAGRAQWSLSHIGAGELRIRRKRVELVNCDAFHQMMTLPL